VDPSGDGLAKANDPSTWSSFEDAAEYHDHAGTDTAGLGYMFASGGPFVGVDLDGCRDHETGDLDAWGRDIVDRLDSYTEVSPSGTGVHVWIAGDLPDGGNRRGDVEMYDSDRFFTVTGEYVEGAGRTIASRQDALDEVHAEYIREDAETAEGDDVDTRTDGVNPRGSTGEVGLDDAELVAKAKDAANGDKFARLWKGNTAGYPSHSEADAALCSLLAFWTGGDRARIDRLFRESGLYRDKWDRDDYRQRTIDVALDGRTEFYDPSDDADPDPSTPSVADLLDETRDRSDPDDGADADTDTTRAVLSPETVRVRCNIHTDEGEEIADLTDREKAAIVWDLIRESDEVHVRVRRENGSLWAFDPATGVWDADGERALRHAARKALGPVAYGQNVVSELDGHARADPAVEVAADEFGLDAELIAVENGFLDLDAAADGAGEDALRDLRPEDYALARLPVRYDPMAEYDEWAAYVEEWAEEGRADALQEYVGYCLHVGEMPIHQALLLVGTGANGKGTFLSVVRALLGRENTSSIELQTLANERDAVADFYGSLANIDDDLSARKLGAGLGMFKKLVGGDRVCARRLYEDGFEFDATGKHLYAANEVPDVSVPESDEAFWRRWLLVEFPNHYPPSERDPDLRDRLTEPDTLSGVLNWAIAGRARLLEQGYFTNEDRYAQAKRERWQAWGESVDKFISECVDRDEDAPRLSTQDAHRRYAAWCRENGLDPVGQRQFTNTLKNEDVGYGRLRIDGSVTRGYKALGLSDDVPALDDRPDREDDPAPSDDADTDDARQQSLF
jgi:putative DNA primase/helicase